MLAALLLAACQNVDESSFEDGMQAYARGDFETAMEKWRPLALGGNPSAQTNIGVMYYQGRGVRRDPAEGVRWYKMAAMKGYPEAMYNLGVAHMNGLGAEKSAEEALRWYRLAAEGGYVSAQLLLGNMYARGQGIAADQQEAVKWFQLAAEQGDATAQFFLAAAYVNGQGVEQDHIQAYKWLLIIYAGDNEQAKAGAEAAMGGLAPRMSPGMRGEAEMQANEWLASRN
jgi:TPR repeat protein